MSKSQSTEKILSSGKKTVLACCLLAVSSVSFADSHTTWFGESADGEWLAGFKLGGVATDIGGHDDAFAGTIVLGYQFSRPAGDRGRSSIEFEFSSSDDADISPSGIRGIGEYDMHTFGVFFNYRSPGTVYFKGKLGVLDSNIDSRFDSGTNIKSNDAAFALGLGFGVRLGGNDGRTSLEVEWVSSSGDNDLNMYNLGLIVEF
jgi:hypothetical protein